MFFILFSTAIGKCLVPDTAHIMHLLTKQSLFSPKSLWGKKTSSLKSFYLSV